MVVICTCDIFPMYYLEVMVGAARDVRRGALPGGGARKIVKKEWKMEGEGGEQQQVNVTPGKPYRWSKPRNILDTDNNGYTM